MASQTIPTLTDEPFYTMRVRLDGTDYLLDVQYNTRTRRYYVSLFSDDEAPLVRGLKCVPEVPLLRSYHFRPGVPAGELMVTIAGPDKRPPEFGELGPGLRCQLTYFPREDVEALVSAAKAAQGAELEPAT